MSELAKRLDYWSSKFRLLDNWIIESEDISEYTKKFSGRIFFDQNMPEVEVSCCPKGICIDQYAFHEIIHVLFTAVRRGGKKEEELAVQDLCKIFKELKDAR